MSLIVALVLFCFHPVFSDQAVPQIKESRELEIENYSDQNIISRV